MWLFLSCVFLHNNNKLLKKYCHSIVSQMLTKQQKFHLVWKKSNNLLPRWSYQLSTEDKKYIWIDFSTYIIFCIFSSKYSSIGAKSHVYQNAPTIFFLSMYVVWEGGSQGDWHYRHNTKKAMVSSNAWGMKFSSMNNMVKKLCRIHLVGQPNAWGAVGFLSKPTNSTS